ncbi:MAG: hypothetical protein V1913_12810 [Fibrobacterota bacterium]
MKTIGRILLIVFTFCLYNCAGSGLFYNENKQDYVPPSSVYEEIAGKPVLKYDHDRVLVVQTDQGEKEFRISPNATVVKDKWPVTIGKLHPNYPVTISYLKENGKYMAYRINQITGEAR